MESRDTASAARSCLVVLIIGGVLLLIVCAITALGVSPLDIDRQVERGAVSSSPVASTEQLMFTVFDVGQGASVAVVTPDGATLVADSGRSQERVDDVVIPYLRDLGVREIDYLVATNPDQDHIGGMPALLTAFEVDTWVDPVVPSTNQTYAESLEIVAERNITTLRARRGTELDLGQEVEADILWPVDPLLLDAGEPSHNDNSVVIQITYGDVTFLITGDIEERAEQQLVELDDNYGLRSDVLVVPHHGSKTSTTDEFIDVVSPDLALVPVGFGNQYDHPHDEVVQRLRFRDITIYRTDLDGTIEVITDGRTFQVSQLGAEGR